MNTAPATSSRTAKLRKLHVLVRQHGLSEDDYRARLERLTGHRSAVDCDDAELEKALGMFHGKQTARFPFQSKIKALFIAAYNLGLFENGSDRALEVFAERQTGAAKLQFLTPANANKVIEALKAMLAREGFAVPDSDDGGMDARRTLLKAQWAKLAAIGAVFNPRVDALDKWISHRIVPHTSSYAILKRHELDQAAIQLGRWIRGALKKQAHGAA